MPVTNMSATEEYMPVSLIPYYICHMVVYMSTFLSSSPLLHVFYLLSLSFSFCYSYQQCVLCMMLRACFMLRFTLWRCIILGCVLYTSSVVSTHALVSVSFCTQSKGKYLQKLNET